jgi:hypothetical protein
LYHRCDYKRLGSVPFPNIFNIFLLIAWLVKSCIKDTFCKCHSIYIYIDQTSTLQSLLQGVSKTCVEMLNAGQAICRIWCQDIYQNVVIAMQSNYNHYLPSCLVFRGVNSGAYPSGAPEFIPCFSGVRVTRSLILCVCFVDSCLSFCTFSFGHCVVCFSSIYGFWLPLWYLQTRLF